MTALLLAAAALSSLIGMGWLALAMDVHWNQVHGHASPPRRTRTMLRALGVVALLASALCCLRVDAPSMALLVWVMLLTASAPIVALTLTHRPRRLRLIWPWR